MPFRDTLDKIVTVYIASLTKREFLYKGVQYRPRSIRISPLIFRNYTCPAKCGGCCPRFTLDYLPVDAVPYEMTERFVIIDDRQVRVLSDVQDDHTEHFCRNLDRASGRCRIHGLHPFACDFELLRFIDRGEKVHFSQKLFGRGWAMLRIDGETGSLCSMLPPDHRTVPDIARKLRRLAQWADHFGIETWISTVLQWVESGPHSEPLTLVPPESDDPQ